MSCKLLHPFSNQVASAEVDLFSLPQTQVAIEDSFMCEIAPLASIDNYDSPIEFLIPSNSELFVDPVEIFLYIKGKIQYADGSSLSQSDEVYLENNFISTFFSGFEVFLNETSTQLGPNHYALQNYIGTLINYGPGAKKGHLSAGGYYDDYDTHVAKFKNSKDKVFDVTGQVFSPIFAQPKLIPNGVDVRLKFTRSLPSYYLRATEPSVQTKRPFVKIQETYIMIKRPKLTPNMFLAVERGLRSETAKYPIDRVDTKITTIPAGTNSISIDNLVLGNLPKKILVAFQNNNILNGSYGDDTFEFKHFDIASIGLYINGNLTGRPFETLFSNDNKVIPLISRAYLSFLANTNGLDQSGNAISLQDFNDGKTIFAFNLEPSYDDCFRLINPVRNGTLSLKLVFRIPLPSVISCITFLQFPSIIEIDSTRNIIIKQ